MSTPQAFVVPSNVLSAVFQYLAAKPYQEVAELISALQQSEPYTDEQPNESIVPEATDAEVPPKSKKS